MLQKDHDPEGKPVPRGPNAGASRGPPIKDQDERKAAAGADDAIEQGAEGTPGTSRGVE